MHTHACSYTHKYTQILYKSAFKLKKGCLFVNIYSFFLSVLFLFGDKRMLINFVNIYSFGLCVSPLG